MEQQVEWEEEAEEEIISAETWKDGEVESGQWYVFLFIWTLLWSPFASTASWYTTVYLNNNE